MKDLHTTFFNLFYREIGDRLDYIEKLGADIVDVTRMNTISGDCFMGECFLLKVTFTIKDGFEEDKVIKCIRDLRNKKDFSS